MRKNGVMDLILRILAWIAASLGAIVGLVGLSIGVDAAVGGGRLDKLVNTQVSPEVRGYLAQPNTPGPHPAVIMIHEFWGLTPSIREKADLLAQEGYVVLAPDTFRGVTTDWLPRAILLSATTPSERVNQDLQTTFNWLAQQKNVDASRIAVMGFCYGGTAALNHALYNPQLAAMATFYGQFVDNPAVLKRLSGPVLGIFGETDNLIPLEEIKSFETALTAASIPHEITVYPGKGHAFVEGAQGIATDPAQGQAWRQFLGFLERRLKNRSLAQPPETIPNQLVFPASFVQGTPLRVALSHAQHHHP